VLQRHLPGSVDFHHAWPGCVGGTDSAGHVVWCEQLCGLDVNTLAALPERQLVQLRMQTMEALEQRKWECAPAGRVYRQHVYVLDCRGAHAGLLLSAGARRVMRIMSTVSAQHYTETLLRCYLVHTHPSARLVWAAIRPLLPPETAAKVRFCGGPKDYLRIMQEDGIPASALPVSLDGSCKGAESLHHLIISAVADHKARVDAAAAAAAAAMSPVATPVLHRDDSALHLKGRDPRAWHRLSRRSSKSSSRESTPSPRDKTACDDNLLEEITLEQLESRPLKSRLARASWSAASLVLLRGRSTD